MGKHHTPAHTRAGKSAQGLPSRTDVRNLILVMAALAVFVIAMIASYSGAFAKPTLHHLDVAVAAPQQLVDDLAAHDTLAVTTVADAGAAHDAVYQRTADAAFVVNPNGHMDIYVAGGGGRSVANAAEAVGRGIAESAGLTTTVTDVAPTTAADPQGTVVFYAVIFLSIGASVGAAAFSRMMGSVHAPMTLLWRTVSLAAFSALLAGGVTLYVDAVLGALTGHTWAVFGSLFLYAMAVGGAVTGVAAAFGTAASAGLAMFLVIIGNAAAAGPVGKPLLSGFYATLNAIVPQGSGVALLRSVQYFGGNGAMTPLATLLGWAAAGCLLALGAAVARSGALATVLTYRPTHDRKCTTNPDGAVLRPRVTSSVD